MRTYTVLIVPEHTSQVRRLKVPHSRILKVFLGVAGFVGVLAFMLVHYFFLLGHDVDIRALQDENIALRTRVGVARDEVARIDAQLQRIDQFAGKIRDMIEINDPERRLAIGPLADDGSHGERDVLYAPGERIEYEDELIDSRLAMRLISAELAESQARALKSESNIRDLRDHIISSGSMLSSMPSLRPAKSRLLTSYFGTRVDPYTNQEVMHKGVDIAAASGASVVAPADGVVVFAGNRGNYGKTMVLDHGFGMQTHFAHLSGYMVAVGQAVVRGQEIAAVGNTGRTTGAHLHYEVRFEGVPQDPQHYFRD